MLAPPIGPLYGLYLESYKVINPKKELPRGLWAKTGCKKKTPMSWHGCPTEGPSSANSGGCKKFWAGFHQQEQNKPATCWTLTLNRKHALQPNLTCGAFLNMTYQQQGCNTNQKQRLYTKLYYALLYYTCPQYTMLHFILLYSASFDVQKWGSWCFRTIM